MLGSTSQVPSVRTPPHGPLRICFLQLVGHTMPVADSVHWPHMRQSNRTRLAVRSTGLISRSARLTPSHCAGRRSQGAQRAHASYTRLRP